MNQHLNTVSNRCDTVLRVQDLCIRLRPRVAQHEGRLLLKECSFELKAGERLTLVGESGAGKSLLAQAIMGTLPNVMQVSGQVQILGRDTHGQRQLTQALWGRQIVMLPQEPWTALNPVMRLRTQVAEAGRYAANRQWACAFDQADRHLEALGLAHAGRKWLHQVSGGMAQRIGMACASQSDARVLMADEPTKGLDAGACEQVAQLLAAAQRQGQALLTITHDLDLALRLGGRVAVMRQGTIVEAGEVHAVLAAPQHAYTKELIAAQPRHWPSLAPARQCDRGATAVKATQISVSFGEQPVLNHANLQIGEGESVGVVGPSGCGKTTLGNVMVGAIKPMRGTISRQPGTPGWRYQKLYQDPVASFAPGQTVRKGIDDLLRLHRLDATPMAGWLQRLRLSSDLLERMPSEVSGGELQRLSILRAMLLQPVFVFADEPTSRLDALTQRDTMTALCEAMADSGCAMLLVSHDQDLARQATHRQWRMSTGRLFEHATAAT